MRYALCVEREACFRGQSYISFRTGRLDTSPTESNIYLQMDTATTMGRKRRGKLKGLAELGARLKELRQKAGLSQMKLAGKMGFNPTHGYKYVFRLEKGLVPNPTLRTITSFLEACEAGWQDIVDLLPSSADPAPETGKARPARKHGRKKGRPPFPKPAPRKEPARPRDSRPLRIRLRSQLLAERAERTRNFWKGVEQAEQATSRLLRSMRMVSSEQHDYLAFVRTCCSIINAFSPAQAKAAEREIVAAVQSAVTKGLDRNVLLRVKAICLERLTAKGHKT